MLGSTASSRAAPRPPMAWKAERLSCGPPLLARPLLLLKPLAAANSSRW